MANIRCRGPWELRVKAHPELSATFTKYADAQARHKALGTLGIQSRLTLSPNASWEARVRRRGYPTCAKCFPNKKLAEEWAKEEQGLLEMSRLNPDAQRLRRFFATGSVPCPIDTQGRILVPGFLRERQTSAAVLYHPTYRYGDVLTAGF